MLQLTFLEEVQIPQHLPKFSLLPAKTLAGQQPIALEEKQLSAGRPLHAQPEKSVTKAVSDAGAALEN